MLKTLMAVIVLVASIGVFGVFGVFNTLRANPTDDQIHIMSIIALIAAPETHDEKSVVVYGVIDGDASGWVVFLGTEDAEQWIITNGIWLETSGVSEQDLAGVDGKWVTIRGVFDKDNKGHLGVFPGSIHSIDRITPFPKPTP